MVRERRTTWQSAGYKGLVLKRHTGLTFGERVTDVNERSWAAVLEAEEEQTEEGALRNGSLR